MTIYELGRDPLTGNVYEFEPSRDSCVVMRSSNARINHGNLAAFLHKIEFEHYNKRIKFNIELIKTLVGLYETQQEIR